jgi:DNA-binding LytR/AlgR family response regulator
MKKPLRALVVDDEPLARDELGFLLAEAGDVEVVGQAGTAAEAIALFEAEEPDVVFCDLRMPGPDGLALAESLLSRDADVLIVMISAHDDGAVRGFEAGVLDYLLKPVRLDRLRKTLDRVAARRPKRRARRASEQDVLTRLAVRRRGKFVVVDVADVIYFQVRDELVWAVTADDRYALDLTLATLEKRVPEGAFFRSHRGTLVRIEAIRKIEPAGAGTFELHLDHPSAPTVPLARERARLLRALIPIAG